MSDDWRSSRKVMNDIICVQTKSIKLNEHFRVLESKNDKFPEGSTVFGQFGWRTHAVLNPTEVQQNAFMDCYILPKCDGHPASLGLGYLGMPGAQSSIVYCFVDSYHSYHILKATPLTSDLTSSASRNPVKQLSLLERQVQSELSSGNLQS